MCNILINITICWAVPILDKLEYNTIVTIIYYEGKWNFVSKKETVDIGKYKFNIR